MCTEFTEGDLDRVGMAVGRREFATLAGVGALAALLPTRVLAGGLKIKGRDVVVTTADGPADAYFVAPAKGKHPGVLMWPDIRGLRPAFRAMAERLAGDGYAVLVVNPFYRSAKAPVVTPTELFSDPAVRERLVGYTKLFSAKTLATDVAAFTAFLDGQKQVDTARKLGTMGYCMSGEFTIYTAAMNANRVGAAASFHGGDLATDKPDSPHLMIPGTNAGYLFAIADNDDQRTPEEKTRLKAVLEPRKQWHEVEVYKGAMHGWCPPDSRAYDQAAAEKAWGRLLELFKASL